jgi:purine-binding chemotaxis protein CheW
METRTIDWEALRLKLAKAAAFIEVDSDQDQEKTRGILEARARLAARPPEKREDSRLLAVLAFSLAGESYGVEIAHIREVCQLKNLTPLPGLPPSVAGVMNLRGRILAIFDLRRLFELPTRGITELNRVIVLQKDGAELGLLADAIDGVREVAASDLRQGQRERTDDKENFIKGIDGRLMALLDAGRLLAGWGPMTDGRTGAQERRQSLDS